MRQRFFTSTAQSRLIKNILCNTPIPIYNTVSQGDYIIKNCKYIYNISLILCTKSGTLEGTGEFLTLDYTFYWGEDKLNHTERLRSNTSYYDSNTHEWLGRYLRAYKNMQGVNLMPFYNCFSGVYTSRFKLLTENYINNYINNNIVIQSIGNRVNVHESGFTYDIYSQGSEAFNEKYVEKSPYKILQIPIKLNKTYTIAIDCSATIKIAPAFINHGKLLSVQIGTQELSLTDLLINNYDSLNNSHPISIEKTNASFLKPFLYTIENKNQHIVQGVTIEEDIGITYEQLLQRYERYLYLLIQVPSDNTSSQVVLEGDFTEAAVDKIFSEESVNLYNDNYTQNLQSYTGTIQSSVAVAPSLNRTSLAPYVSYVNIEGLSFNSANNLTSFIQDIILDDNYGYVEYEFKQHQTNPVYNLSIFSYIPLPIGLPITVTWYNNKEVLNTTEADYRQTSSFSDDVLLSKLSLLQFNDNKNYTFADTLVEYLLLNVIDGTEEISNNMKRIQEYFGLIHNKNFTFGAWNDALRKTIFNEGKYTKTISHLDSIGYVDKNIEVIITRGV